MVDRAARPARRHPRLHPQRRRGDGVHALADPARGDVRARRPRAARRRHERREGALAIDSSTGEEEHVPALHVEAVDATGAGDVFHAAIASAPSPAGRCANGSPSPRCAPGWPSSTSAARSPLPAGATSSTGGAGSRPTPPAPHGAPRCAVASPSSTRSSPTSRSTPCVARRQRSRDSPMSEALRRPARGRLQLSSTHPSRRHHDPQVHHGRRPGRRSLTAAACAPGGSGGEESTTSKAASEVETDPAAMGDITLTVWDQEVRGGQDKQMKALNAAFEKKYPNITIKRVSRSFDDLTKTLRLALTGDDAPDVVQAKQHPLADGPVRQGQADHQPRPLRRGVRLARPLPGVGAVRRLLLPGREDLRRGQHLRPAAGRRGRRHLLRQEDDGGPRHRAAEDLGAVRGGARDGQGGRPRPRSCSATSRSGRRCTSSARSRVATPTPRRSARSATDGPARAGRRGQRADRRHARRLGRQGYFNEGFNGEGYDAAWQSFSKGDGLFSSPAPGCSPTSTPR